ncbi:MAG: RsmD family RNA methyltransferase [Candidatus Nomurabacteria bacterium]|nr:RsmD family RNA methyltransferase [Candidatus Saccharibacteria bacterium]USN95432.1 MAG: RsmD family RNA methyltransferase [Candidatus Nomurabacteria bacterium]
MRIISGIYGGRTIQSPSGHKTHPMSEKMRGAIFNALGDIKGLSFLDAYGGSGAVALEAISRGATNVTAIDSDKNAIQTIKANAHALKADVKVTQVNISSWLDNNPGHCFDIIVADPPYNNVNKTHLYKLAKALNSGGVIIYSLPPKEDIRLSDSYQILSEREYGDSRLVFYRFIG